MQTIRSPIITRIHTNPPPIEASASSQPKPEQTNNESTTPTQTYILSKIDEALQISHEILSLNQEKLE